MTTLEDIEKAVAQLPPEKLMEFRTWFEEFDAALFDARLEIDSRAGKLDGFAEEARSAFKQGSIKDI
ncbi:MAG TPA: hypothetical protein VGL35_01845 [Rhizomicrobium sp.]|jgi:hypothetical protein